MKDLLVEIFYAVDNHSIAFENHYKRHSLEEVSDSEI